MKIGLVALTYAPGTAGGVETYFLNLIDGLQQIDHANQYVIFVPPAATASIKLTAPNFRIQPVSEGLLAKLARKLRLTRRFSAAAQVNRQRCDVLHFPFQVITPAGISGPKILSFMDMQQEYFPEFFSASELEARRQSYRSSCDAADHIVAISNHTKQTLIERYQIPAAKVTTIYLSYNHILYKGKPAKLTLELPQPYLYYPAATWPHKNHQRLLEAFAAFTKDHPKFSLVLSGIKKQHNDSVTQAIERLGLTNVVVLGYLPYDQLPAIYQNATAMIFPSLFEGFGIPLLEAMACSCPVAASNTTSIPEVAGDAALYFDPLDVPDITRAMTEITNSQKRRDALLLKGHARAKLFSDQIMAKQTLALYNSRRNQS